MYAYARLYMCTCAKIKLHVFVDDFRESIRRPSRWTEQSTACNQHNYRKQSQEVWLVARVMRSYNSSGKLQCLISDLDYSLLIDSSNLLFIGQTSSRAAETRLAIIVRRAVSCHEETAPARASGPSMFDWRSAIPPRAASCINSMPWCVTELWISSAGRDALHSLRSL